MPEQVNHLSWHQRFNRAVHLSDAVDEVGDAHMADRMQPFPLDSNGFEDTVVASVEVDQERVVPVLVGDERCILIEALLRAQIENRINGRLVQWHVALARRVLELWYFTTPEHWHQE